MAARGDHLDPTQLPGGGSSSAGNDPMVVQGTGSSVVVGGDDVDLAANDTMDVNANPNTGGLLPTGGSKAGLLLVALIVLIVWRS